MKCKSLLIALAIVVSTAQAASGVSIEFTYFYPNRIKASKAMKKKWGDNWKWPLTTFPHPWRGAEKKLDDAYGLVYWPGEIIKVHLKDVGDSKVDRVSCKNVLTDQPLPVKQIDATTWAIGTSANLARSIPKEGPYLGLYRVQATHGRDELASRGVIVTRPWSGVIGKNDPSMFDRSIQFGEWTNGSNPYSLMCFTHGQGWPRSGKGYRTIAKDDAFAMRNRPWPYVTTLGLPDLYGLRLNYKNGGFRNKHKSDRRSMPTTEAYLDPSLEWNVWWQYYDWGTSHWKGHWQWGPFNEMSAERLTKPRLDICYGDVKRYSAAMPNGMLFWQWNYFGLKKLVEHTVINSRRSPRIAVGAYDGWSEGNGYHKLGGGLRGTWARTQEVGAMRMYYLHCKAAGTDTSWTRRFADFKSFMEAQHQDYYANANKLNDYYLSFLNQDLNLRNTSLWVLAPHEVYRKITGKGTGKPFPDDVPYKGGKVNGVNAIDRVAFGGLGKNERPINQPWAKIFQTVIRTGDDYSHNARLNVGSEWVKQTRGYRAMGLRGATWCALYPNSIYDAGGFRNAVRNNPDSNHNYGAPMPGTKYFKNANKSFSRYKRFEDDGTTFRRMFMFSRLPMFFKADGKVSGYHMSDIFGTRDYAPSNTAMWNTQGILGNQVMEIPDRAKPLGAVVILDSKNQADGRKNRAFVQTKFADYLSALFDELGVAVYTNPKTAEAVPESMPRIYLPRHDGGKQAYMIAKVAGREIRVPYTGLADQRPSSRRFQSFVRQIKSAYPGPWPVQADGGFVATAWESSHGVFVYVENPMRTKGEISTARKGTIRVTLPEALDNPAVIDLCGNKPNPHRLPAQAVHAGGRQLAFDLDWPKGDARLFWITNASAWGR